MLWGKKPVRFYNAVVNGTEQLDTHRLNFGSGVSVRKMFIKVQSTAELRWLTEKSAQTAHLCTCGSACTCDAPRGAEKGCRDHQRGGSRTWGRTAVGEKPKAWKIPLLIHPAFTLLSDHINSTSTAKRKNP